MIDELTHLYDHLSTVEKLELARLQLQTGDLLADKVSVQHGCSHYMAALYGFQRALTPTDQDSKVLARVLRHVADKLSHTICNDYAVRCRKEADSLDPAGDTGYCDFQVVAISGPSAAGKTTLIREMKRRFPWCGYAISATKRAPRWNETTDNYRFMSELEFEENKKAHKFLEFSGNYATEWAELDRLSKKFPVIVLDVNTDGGRAIRARYPQNTTLIAVIPPSYYTLETRLRNRNTEDEPEIQRRLIEGKALVRDAYIHYDNFVVTESNAEAIWQMEQILHSIAQQRSSYICSAIERYFREFEMVHSDDSPAAT